MADQPTTSDGTPLHELKKQAPRSPDQIATDNPKSMRAAVNFKCWQCSNFQKIEVTLCTVTGCGLYPFRPWQRTKQDRSADGVQSGFDG